VRIQAIQSLIIIGDKNLLFRSSRHSFLKSLASTPPLAYRRLSLPRIDVKNEEQFHFTPFGQMIVPNDRKILQRKIDSSSLSKSPILKNTRPAPRPPPMPLSPTCVPVRRGLRLKGLRVPVSKSGRWSVRADVQWRTVKKK